MTSIVFSKDRALQLDAFLRSYRVNVADAGEVRVLYLATSMRHARAYAGVFAGHPGVASTPQSLSFKQDLLSLLPRDGHVIFFVDDIVFVRPWSGYGEPGLSLRLGLHLTHNYATGGTLQPLPGPRTEHLGGTVMWRWADGREAWGYPLALDGHVFDAQEMLEMAASCVFHSPNTFESALQKFLPQFINRMGTCYRETKIVNIPWNRVQTDWRMLCGSGNDVEQMLAHWEAGKQIDLRGIYGVLNTSVHQEFPLVLEDR
jgi:hypothetical protein